MTRPVGYPPKKWDVIMFFVDEQNIQCVETFEVAPVGAVVNGNTVIEQESTEPISDRVACKVGLVSVRKNLPCIEEPFTSHFFDPFVYAERMLNSGFTGIMVKAGSATLDAFFDLTYGILAHNVKQTASMAVQNLSKECEKK